jgi:hypothetical protein
MIFLPISGLEGDDWFNFLELFFVLDEYSSLISVRALVLIVRMDSLIDQVLMGMI